jgi:hypothetical protein
MINKLSFKNGRLASSIDSYGTYRVAYNLARIYSSSRSKNVQWIFLAVLRIIQDQVLFDPWILDPGLGGKNPDPDPGFGMNIPNHISESLVTISWVKNTFKYFASDQVPCIRDRKNLDPGS